MWVKAPVHSKFEKKRIIPEGDRTSLNVAVIIKEHEADNQLWLGQHYDVKFMAVCLLTPRAKTRLS